MLSVILALVGLGAGYLYKDKIYTAAKKLVGVKPQLNASFKNVVLTPAEKKEMVGPAKLVIPDQWVQMEFDGETWEVSPDYIAPVGIGEALELAKKANAQLPTPRMSDAIWKAADCKIEPRAMTHDGTLKMMLSKGLVAEHEGAIQRQIELAGNPDYKLIAGHYKDVVQKDGKLYLYGWHVKNEDAANYTKRTGIPLERTVTPGLARVIQGENPGKHDYGWKDYSQGARFVRKVNRDA